MKLTAVALLTLMLLASCGRGNRGDECETSSITEPHTGIVVS